MTLPITSNPNAGSKAVLAVIADAALLSCIGTGKDNFRERDAARSFAGRGRYESL